MPIKIPNVDKFLFCLKLETGGLILGWLGGLGAGIGLITSLLAFGLVVTNYPAFLNATTATDVEQRKVLETLQYRKNFDPRTIFFIVEYLNFSQPSHSDYSY